jgi:hypothetical protein
MKRTIHFLTPRLKVFIKIKRTVIKKQLTQATDMIHIYFLAINKMQSLLLYILLGVFLTFLILSIIIAWSAPRKHRFSIKGKHAFITGQQ